MCVQNLKFVALPIPEIIGVPKNVRSPWIRPRSLFSTMLMGSCSDGPCYRTLSAGSAIPTIYPSNRRSQKNGLTSPRTDNSSATTSGCRLYCSSRYCCLIVGATVQYCSVLFSIVVNVRVKFEVRSLTRS